MSLRNSPPINCKAPTFYDIQLGSRSLSCDFPTGRALFERNGTRDTINRNRKGGEEITHCSALHVEENLLVLHSIFLRLNGIPIGFQITFHFETIFIPFHFHSISIPNNIPFGFSFSFHFVPSPNTLIPPKQFHKLIEMSLRDFTPINCKAPTFYDVQLGSRSLSNEFSNIPSPFSNAMEHETQLTGIEKGGEEITYCSALHVEENLLV
ncbi:hypothetical protein CEXT_158411 [Caerostris extrusa]|uniref:Ribosomal protein L5 n=1 Tax=Caerostris extrusa TaxID=172846 RepID=A0AAV4W3N7_CAEEX|nr:hypothetical protein CEXT_158411 [Caerostris extrusa]